MSLFNLLQTASIKSPVDMAKLREVLANEGDTVFDKDLGTAMVGLESEYKVDPVKLENLNNQFDTVKVTLQQAMPGLSEVGLESAARAAMLLGDTSALGAKIENIGLESFSKTQLANYREETVAVNAMTAESGSILDQLYPIVEVGANYGGIEINLKRFVRVRNFVNPQDGSVMDFGRQHLAEGYRDSDALSGNTNVLYPIVVTGSNESMFVESGLLPYSNVEGTEYKTSALKASADEINLLGLSRLPGAAATSRTTYNDRIDEGGSISSLFIQVGEDKTGASGDDERGLVEIPLGIYNTAQFIRGANVGGSDETHVNFDANTLTVDLTSSKAQGIVALKALADLGYATLTFAMRLNAKLDLHSGNYSETFSNVKISGIYKPDDVKNYVGDGAISGELGAVLPTFAGKAFDLTISSKTLRLQGMRVDDQDLPFTFHVGAISPVTADRSIDEVDVASALTTMSAAEVIEREAAAVRFTMKRIDELNAAFGTNGHNVVPEGHSMAGLSFILEPWVQVEELELSDIVDSQKSKERFEDIQAALMHLLADRASEAVTKTAYVETKRLYGGNASAKAKFTILTDRNIGRYLYTEGDDRSFGALEDIEQKPAIVTSSLDTLDDTIIMVPASTEGAGSFDVWGWGNTLRAPSVVYDVQLSSDGGAKRHLQLAPHYAFTNNMPIAYKVTIKGLSDFLKSKAPQLTKSL